MSGQTRTAQASRRGLPTWLFGTIAGLFGLFYAYAVWGAVGFLVQQAGGAEGLTGYGWFVLLLPIVFPIVVFGAAIVLGRRRGILPLVMILLSGLALVAVFWLDVFSYAAATSSLYGA